MERNKTTKHTIDILFVITLFCIFAISVLLLTGTGAGVYEKIVGNMTTNYNTRTANTYLFNKIHRADKNGYVSVGEFGGSKALIMKEEVNNVFYCTYIYNYEGELKELFVRENQEIPPEFGTTIFQLDNFSIEEVSGSLLRFSYTTEEGEDGVLYVHTRTGGDS